MFLVGLGILWDWLIKARSRMGASEEEQTANQLIQHVIPPLDTSARP